MWIEIDDVKAEEFLALEGWAVPPEIAYIIERIQHYRDIANEDA
jgi:hypothetical protein